MSHWSEKKEKGGSLWQMRLMLFLYKRVGINFFRFFLSVISLFFFIFCPSVRRVSKSYLSKIDKYSRTKTKANLRGVFTHVNSFSNLLIEKIGAWSGNFEYTDLVAATPDINTITAELSKGNGAVILCSHLGNVEMLRAIAILEAGKNIPDFNIHSIVDLAPTAKFNTLMEEVNPDYKIKLINASDIDASTIIQLQDCIENGDLVVIAGDRTAKNNKSKNFKVNFLGEEAYFPMGAFILATILEAPIYYMFALRERDLDYNSAYEFHVYKSRFDIVSTRKERNKKIHNLIEEYVGHLEGLCLKHPFQWFNFFDFWKNPDISN